VLHRSCIFADMSALEHVLQNGMDFVDVSSSALSPASALPEEDVVNVVEETHAPDDEIQSEPLAEEEFNPIHVLAAEPTAHQNPASTIALVRSPSEFFEEEEDDALPSEFRDENGRPFGSAMSLPIVTAVGDHVDLRQVVSSVITSLEDNSRDLEELTALPTPPVNHVEHVHSGAVYGPLPSFHDVIRTVPRNQQPSVNFEAAFDQFLMTRSDGVVNDVPSGDFERHMIHAVAMEEIVDEDGHEEPEDCDASVE
jgi:hypothetical protein